MPVIERLTDTDLYKITMGQAVFHRFPQARAEYAFRCRTPHVDLARFAREIQAEVQAMAGIHGRLEELRALRGLRFLTDDYVDFLSLYRFDPREVKVVPENDGSLRLRVRGPWRRTIFWEVPLLAIVQEVYTRNIVRNPDFEGARARLQRKIETIRSSDYAPYFKLAEFGTRRRFSRAWHSEVVATLAQALPEQFVGTSNVHFAMENGLTPIGTMAHEYLQAAQALAPELAGFQAFALEHWMQEFRGDLGIALTDVIGMKSFLKDFDRLFAKAYDGLRHDSGDPVEWGEQAIAHFERYGIDPRTKSLVFSDGLDIPKALEILEHFAGRINVSFGIGTNLTNDIPGFKPLNIVMKLVALNGQPVAKLSDAPGKTLCEDEDYVRRLRELFEHGAVEAA